MKAIDEAIYAGAELNAWRGLPTPKPVTKIQRQTKKKRPSQIAKERTRKIALILWQQAEASITVPDMAEMGEIVAVAKDYQPSTRIKWLRGVNPNPKAGRPRKDS